MRRGLRLALVATTVIGLAGCMDASAPSSSPALDPPPATQGAVSTFAWQTNRTGAVGFTVEFERSASDACRIPYWYSFRAEGAQPFLFFETGVRGGGSAGSWMSPRENAHVHLPGHDTATARASGETIWGDGQDSLSGFSGTLYVTLFAANLTPPPPEATNVPSTFGFSVQCDSPFRVGEIFGAHEFLLFAPEFMRGGSGGHAGVNGFSVDDKAKATLSGEKRVFHLRPAEALGSLSVATGSSQTEYQFTGQSRMIHQDLEAGETTVRLRIAKRSPMIGYLAGFDSVPSLDAAVELPTRALDV